MKKSFYFLFLLFILLTSELLAYKITFIVKVPDYTPKDAKVYVAGSFNNWNPGDSNYELKREGTTFIGTFDFDGKIEYKFTRGSWEAVEKGEKGEEISNRTFNLNRDSILNIKYIIGGILWKSRWRV